MTSKFVVAGAGSGKTTYLVDRALSPTTDRVLIVSYTNANVDQIRERIRDRLGLLPAKVDVSTWFEFITRDGLRPYLSTFMEVKRVPELDFLSHPPMYAPKADFSGYFFSGEGRVFADRASELAVWLDGQTKGKVIRRIGEIYDLVLIDEVQDLAGWDLDFISAIAAQGTSVIGVGDPRQSLYSTNHGNKNKQFRGKNIVNWMEQQRKIALFDLEHLSTNYRCCQQICDFADKLFPDLPRSTSGFSESDHHLGVFLVHLEDRERYEMQYSPRPLRHNVRTANAPEGAVNFGEAKGLEFDRVLIYPTLPIVQYLRGGDVSKLPDPSRFYVAATRGKKSLAIVIPQNLAASPVAPIWQP